MARKHLAWYSRGLPGSAEFRAAVKRLAEPAAVMRLVDAFYDPLVERRARPSRAGAAGGVSGVTCVARLGARPVAPAAPDAVADARRNLPVPVVLLDAEDRFRFANQAAEQFLGLSVGSSWRNLRLRRSVPAGQPAFPADRPGAGGGCPIADHDLTLEGPRLRKRGIRVQGTPLPEEPGAVLLVLQDASAARALDRQLTFRGAARSVTGMAAMLAHEVKNPLSGIRGAAQLLEGASREPTANSRC